MNRRLLGNVCLTLVAISSWGCRPAEVPIKPVASAAKTPTSDAALSPLDSIQGAEFQSFTGVAEPWMLPGKIDSVSAAQTQLQVSIDRLSIMENDNSQKLAGSIDMMMRLIVLETTLDGNRCDGPCLDSRINAYRIFQTWNLLFEINFVHSLFDGAVDMLGINLSSDKKLKFRQFVQSSFGLSAQNWRALSIERIRFSGTSDSRKMELLEELAQDESRRSAYRTAAGLYELALPLAKEEHRSTIDTQMAINCYRELDIPCGDKARDKALSRPVSPAQKTNAETATDLQRLRSAAMRISRSSSSSVEARLVRGFDSIELVRYSEAKALFESLRKELPRDARPIVGLATILIEEGFRVGEAHKMLVAARGLENRELAYYEMRIGTWFEDFKTLNFSQSGGPNKAIAGLSGQLRDVEEAIEEYARLVPDKGQALRHAVAIGEVLIQMQLGRMQEVDLRNAIDAAIPEVNGYLQNKESTLYLRRLQLILSRFDADGKRALTSVGRKESLVELVDMHAALRFALVMVHNTGHAEFASDLKLNSSFVGRDLRSSALAVLALQKQDKAMWMEVETLVEALLSEAPDEENRFRLTNNLAVAKYRLGKVGEAQSILGSLVASREKASVASINAPAMDKNSGPEDFAALSGSGMDDLLKGAKVAARRWIARKEKGRKLEVKEHAALAASVSQGLGRRSFGERGVLLENSFHLGVGYSTVDKLVIELDMRVLPWFVLPASE